MQGSVLLSPLAGPHALEGLTPEEEFAVRLDHCLDGMEVRGVGCDVVRCGAVRCSV